MTRWRYVMPYMTATYRLMAVTVGAKSSILRGRVIEWRKPMVAGAEVFPSARATRYGKYVSRRKNIETIVVNPLLKHSQV